MLSNYPFFLKKKHFEVIAGKSASKEQGAKFFSFLNDLFYKHIHRKQYHTKILKPSRRKIEKYTKRPETAVTLIFLTHEMLTISRQKFNRFMNIDNFKDLHITFIQSISKWQFKNVMRNPIPCNIFRLVLLSIV